MLKLLFVFRLLSEVTEDVVENEVAVCLFGKYESLGKALVWLALVGDLANDLDDDVCVGSLRIDIGNADLCVMEIELLDAIVDSLSLVSYCGDSEGCSADLLTNANVDLVLLVTRDELRAFVVKELESHVSHAN